MSTANFLAAAGRFGHPNVCPWCAAPLRPRGGLRNPQDFPAGQACDTCGGAITFHPEILGEGVYRRIWWIPARPSDRFSRVSGRELTVPSTVEWEELGGSPQHTFCVLDPSGSLAPRVEDAPWSARTRWRMPGTSGPSERIASVTLARGMLVVASENGTLRFCDPETGRPITRQPLQLRQELHSETVPFPPTFRGWWVAVAGDQALVLCDLSPMATRRDETALSRQAHVLPSGWRWAGAVMAIDGEKLHFAAVAEEASPFGAAKLVVLDPAPVRDRQPPRVVAEIPMRPAVAPIQLPDMPGFPYAGHVVWVSREGAVFAMDPKTWTAVPISPPPLGGGLLASVRGNVAVSGDRGAEALWMLMPDESGQPALRRCGIGRTWETVSPVDPAIVTDGAWIAVHPWQPDGPDAWVSVAGATYHEIYRRAGAECFLLNRGDWSINLHLCANNVPARTVSPPVLTPAGLVSFHPFEVRLTSPSAHTRGLTPVRHGEGLCGPSSSFFTFAAARGASVWCGTEGSEVVRVDFFQEAP